MKHIYLLFTLAFTPSIVVAEMSATDTADYITTISKFYRSDSSSVKAQTIATSYGSFKLIRWDEAVGSFSCKEIKFVESRKFEYIITTDKKKHSMLSNYSDVGAKDYSPNIVKAIIHLCKLKGATIGGDPFD